MDADLCLGDNLILFRCFAKTSNFQSKFATTNSNFEKNNFLDMHYCITYMYINFQQILVSIDQSKPGTHIYLQIIATCINLQLPIVILKKRLFRHASSYDAHVYQFLAKSGLYVSLVNRAHNLFAKKSQVV